MDLARARRIRAKLTGAKMDFGIKMVQKRTSFSRPAPVVGAEIAPAKSEDRCRNGAETAQFCAGKVGVERIGVEAWAFVVAQIGNGGGSGRCPLVETKLRRFCSGSGGGF